MQNRLDDLQNILLMGAGPSGVVDAIAASLAAQRQ